MTKKTILVLLMVFTLFILACSKSEITKETETQIPTTTEENKLTNITTGGNSGIITNSDSEFDESKGFTDDNGCYDSEGAKFYDKKGYIIDAKKLKYEDNCSTEKTLKEYYCGQLGYKEEELYSCPYGCSNGVCLKTGQITQECTKSDFKDYYKKGTASYKGELSEDYCKDSNNMVEYFCTNVGILSQEQKYCTYGCMSGACVDNTAAQENSCVDSDFSGTAEFTKGIVTDPKGTIEDSCINSNTVKEWKCSSVGFRTSINVACANGCVDGACKE